jgi:hypothetical protein
MIATLFGYITKLTQEKTLVVCVEAPYNYSLSAKTPYAYYGHLN